MANSGRGIVHLQKQQTKINSSFKAKEFLEIYTSDLGYESTDQESEIEDKEKGGGEVTERENEEADKEKK